MLVTPYLAYVVTYITSLPTPTISAFLDRCAARVYGIHADILAELEPTTAPAVVLPSSSTSSRCSSTGGPARRSTDR